MSEALKSPGKKENRTSNWMKRGNARVYLAGKLTTFDYDTHETTFLFDLALKHKDDGMIKNIALGKAIEVIDKESGKKNLVLAPTITCYHDTIPRTNYTAFYRRLNKTEIILIGSGSHIGKDNKHYFVQWADGSETSDLFLDDQKKVSNELIKDPKRLDETGKVRAIGDDKKSKKKKGTI